MRKRTIAPRHTNRKMSSEVYALRRQVMNCIYDAKRLLNNKMARVEVRITDCKDHQVLGSALMNGCVVWIPAKTIDMPHDKLRQTVFHELLHTLIGQPHVQGCPLMSPVHTSNLTPSQQNKLFLKYMK
ncbi:MAG: hypothetical protein KAS32_06485 [Candidatus Peribacteraceae bacterium]|nr:hypothetical protein [Candidatus Peribacteraceae bacterium]